MCAAMSACPILPATDAAIERAAALLRAGGLVAFPTETVYGLAADATDDAAVARLYAAKGRPSLNPLIVHLADAADLAPLVEADETADRLARRFWPGPLTLVLPRRAGCAVTPRASAGRPTLAVRVPAHPVARSLIAETGRPLVAPSANRSGRVSPTRAAHVAAELGDAIDLVLDGGEAAVGVESTVVDPARRLLLRPGGVTAEALAAEIGPLAPPPAGSAAAPDSPGLLASHYAPACPVRLEAADVAADEALLAFGPAAPRGAAATLNLSPAGDLAEAAANLYDMLRRLDRPGIRAIAVVPLPGHGLGAALNDRLRRAAAPRS